MIVPVDLSASLVAVGDIAGCREDFAADLDLMPFGDTLTAALADSLPGAILGLGDMVYLEGTLEQYQRCFEPNWGRHRRRIRPTPGNHDYSRIADGGETTIRNLDGYFAYFGENAGPQGRGYYRFQVGLWEVLSLNSEFDLTAGAPQILWLESALRSGSARCSLAFFHRPRFSSSPRGDEPRLEQLWQMLDEAGVDVVLNGHNHHYERFSLQDSQGRPSADGIRQFTVGTGGFLIAPPKLNEPGPQSEFISSEYGVLALDLSANGYDWRLMGARGVVLDSGHGDCR